MSMTANGWLQIIFFFVVILAITKPLGVYMAAPLSVGARPDRRRGPTADGRRPRQLIRG